MNSNSPIVIIHLYIYIVSWLPWYRLFFNCIDDVMVSVLASSEVDSGFEHRTG